MIDSLGIRSELKMFDSLPRQEIIKYYQNAELNIIPTLYETFVYLFAQAGIKNISIEKEVNFEKMYNEKNKSYSK